MNGTSRLYRSTSERLLGGVAAGLGNYFKIDANIVRLIWLVLALITGGGFALIYLALWLLLPTATSTSTDTSSVFRENLNDIGAQFTNFTGMRTAWGNTQPTGSPADANVTPNSGASSLQPQRPQTAASTQPRQGNVPMLLILIGGFFLLMNMGFFRGIHWGIWWPFLLIGMGVMMLSRRR